MSRKYQPLIKEAVASLGTVHKLQPASLRFGAAVLTKKGNIYRAANYWSYTATLTLHAEQAALAHAAAHGERTRPLRLYRRPKRGAVLPSVRHLQAADLGKREGLRY